MLATVRRFLDLMLSDVFTANFDGLIGPTYNHSVSEAPTGPRVARPDVIGCILSQTLRMTVEGRI